jgi:hypothetical protein
VHAGLCVRVGVQLTLLRSGGVHVKNARTLPGYIAIKPVDSEEWVKLGPNDEATLDAWGLLAVLWQKNRPKYVYQLQNEPLQTPGHALGGGAAPNAAVPASGKMRSNLNAKQHDAREEEKEKARRKAELAADVRKQRTIQSDGGNRGGSENQQGLGVSEGGEVEAASPDLLAGDQSRVALVPPPYPLSEGSVVGAASPDLWAGDQFENRSSPSLSGGSVDGAASPDLLAGADDSEDSETEDSETEDSETEGSVVEAASPDLLAGDQFENRSSPSLSEGSGAASPDLLAEDSETEDSETDSERVDDNGPPPKRHKKPYPVAPAPQRKYAWARAAFYDRCLL